MGNYLCKHQRIKILFLGLEGGGKTSLVHHLKLGEVVSTLPTIGYHDDDVNIDGVEVNLQEPLNRGNPSFILKHWFYGTNGFAFVIDSTRESEFQEAFDEFFNVLYYTPYGVFPDGTGILPEYQNRDAVFMVIANKQDLPGAKSAQEIEDYLLKRTSKRNQDSILVVPCNALDVQQVSQIFTFFTHLICLNLAGKLKRGFITLKEQKEMEEKWKESTLNILFKNPLDYMRSLF
ncbi:hypothetical protein BsWGS_23682 [Bradybaena similaris]